jgi:acyl-CoA reductase-like NAD-dependent aldehyde dehydrogenase
MAIATKDYGLFIGGETVEGGEVRDISEPATGAALARASMAGPEDVDRAVEAARGTLEGAWAKTPPNERSRLIHALADAIVANRKELVELETRNVGKAVTSVK